MIKKIKSFPAKINWRSTLRGFFFLTAGSLIAAINVNLFLAPSEIAPGGVSGAAIILNKFTAWPIGLTMLGLNIPVVVIGFKYLGRFNFLFRTLYVVLLFSLGVDLLKPWLPTGGVTDNLILNALYGGVVGGIGTGLIYRGQGTSGGTGVLGRVLQLKTGFPISQLYLLIDGGIVLIAGWAFGWDKALFAMVTLYIWGIAADQILEGPSVVRTAMIVTDRPNEVAEAVFERLRLGITAWPAKGMFTEESHTVLFFAISRPNVDALKSVVLSVDRQAFIVIAHGHQTVGGISNPFQAMNGG
jgi:uncharacterized membrane-anchored protein YitT (DUF2179 family)